MKHPEQEARYLALREELRAFEPELTDEELDAWIIDAMSAFKVCPTDVAPGNCIMKTTSTETKIKALEALLS